MFSYLKGVVFVRKWALYLLFDTKIVPDPLWLDRRQVACRQITDILSELFTSSSGHEVTSINDPFLPHDFIRLAVTISVHTVLVPFLLGQL
jgi:hypothetical protein